MARWGSRAVDGTIVCSLFVCFVFAARPRGNFLAQTLGIGATLAAAGRLLDRKRPEVNRPPVQTSSTLVSIVAHEIRAPLASIRGAVGLLEQHDAALEPTRRRELLNVALDASRQLAHLVDDLLLISRIAGRRLSVERTVVDLAGVVRDAAQAEVNGSVTVVEADGLPHVIGDSMRIRQVVTNLISNALTNASESSIVLASIARDGDTVRVTVFNDGRGIAPEEQSRLFVPFASMNERRVDSTGLGLYIAKELVEAMGGTIGFETQPGQNAAFWFTLRAVTPGDSRARPTLY